MSIFIFYYSLFYTISIVLINLYSLKLQKDNELPIAIILYGIILGFVQSNNKIKFGFKFIGEKSIFLPKLVSNP